MSNMGGLCLRQTSAPYLLRDLGAGAAIAVRSETLDLAMELLRRFGAVPEDESRLPSPFLGSFIAQLDSTTPLVCKRAVAAIAALAPALSIRC